MRNLKLKLILFTMAFLLLLACEKQDIWINVQDNVETLNTYKTSPTADCPGGQLHVELKEGDQIRFNHVECLQKGGDTIIIPQCPPSALIHYIPGVDGSCDTILAYFDTEPPKGYNPGDSIYYELAICDHIIFIHDTTFVHDTTPGEPYPVYDSIPYTVYDSIPYPVYDTVFIKGHDYAREKFFEACNNKGDSPYYWSIGWRWRYAFSINVIGSPNRGFGAAILWEDAPHDTLWTPELFSEPMDLDSFSVDIGSLESYEVTLLVKDSGGNIYTIKTVNSYTDGFDWLNIKTYNTLSYSTDIKNPEYKNITNIGLAVKKLGSFTLDNRSDHFNAKNFRAIGSKRLD